MADQCPIVAHLDPAEFTDEDRVLFCLKNHYEKALASGKRDLETVNGTIIAIYEGMIKPCITCGMPYALEQPFQGNVIGVVNVAEVVGPKAPITNFYEAITIILLAEPTLHDHPDDHQFHMKLVGLVLCICGRASSLLSRMREGVRAFSAIAVVYGPAGKGAQRLAPFDGNHNCSISISLPSWSLDPDMPKAALKHRYDSMNSNVPGVEDYVVSFETANPNGLVELWPLGNCAEIMPMIRRATERSDGLFGLCIYADKWTKAVKGHVKGLPVCGQCGIVANCLSCTFTDMATTSVFPRNILTRRMMETTVPTILVPHWNMSLKSLAVQRELELKAGMALSGAH